MNAQTLITTNDVNNINTNHSAFETQIYKDTETNQFYIGLSDGTLKIIGDFSKTNTTLSGNGTASNPLGLAQQGANSGQVLSWNGTSWVPVNAAPANTTVSNTVTAPNSITTTVNGTTGAAVNMVTGVSNTSSNNSLSTTVNGVIGANVNIINSISNAIAFGQLTTTVNGVSSSAVTLPTADGSETKINNGTNTTVTGAGTIASPYLINVADATTTAKGVIQLAGDLTGTATSPQIAANAVTTAEILDGTVSSGDIGNAQVLYAKIQNVTGQRLLGNPTTTAAAPSEISLGSGLTFSGTVLNTVNNGTVTNVTGNAPITVTNGTTTPNISITRNNIVAGTSSNTATNPLVLDAGATSAVVGGANATLTVNNTAPLWNANELQGRDISNNAPSNGQALVWNGTNWTPTNVTTGPTTVSNTVNGFQFTTTVNGVTGNPVNLPFAGVGIPGLIALNCDLTGDVWCPRIAPNAVNSDKIHDGEVKTADLAWGAVTTDKIADNNVTLAKLQQIPGLTLIGNPYGSTGTPIAINIGTGFSISSGNTLNATGSSWSLTGNSGTNPPTNFLGTTDYNRLIFKTNNIEWATFLPTGYFGLGITNPSATFHNNGTTVFSVRSIPNKPTGGDIESAANSVNIGTTFSVNQTTTGQTLTLPYPYPATAGIMVKISNSGTAAFTMYNTTIPSSKFAEFMWTGSTWIPMTGGSTSVVNKKLVLSAEYAGAVVTPGSGTNHNGDLYGGNSGAVSPYYYMNYYEWMGRSASSSQTYQVIARITLPNDFTEWQTNALQIVNMSQTGCSVTIQIFNVSSGASIYNGSALTNTSWTTTSISNASLSTWITPGQTAAFVITFSSTNGNYSRIGDIILNYK